MIGRTRRVVQPPADDVLALQWSAGSSNRWRDLIKSLNYRALANGHVALNGVTSNAEERSQA